MWSDIVYDATILWAGVCTIEPIRAKCAQSTTLEKRKKCNKSVRIRMDVMPSQVFTIQKRFFRLTMCYIAASLSLSLSLYIYIYNSLSLLLLFITINNISGGPIDFLVPVIRIRIQ